MYAIVRQHEYRAPASPEERQAFAQAQAQAQARARALHSAQPGYVGSLVVDDGHQLTTVNLWQSEQDAAAGREVIGAQVQRLLEPLMAAPSRMIAAGPVLDSDQGGLPGLA
ncbi:MAG TPA: hypothetical protein VGI64_01110 [Streptosporangiaceae bacterium]|jgi:hypothetical protein